MDWLGAVRGGSGGVGQTEGTYLSLHPLFCLKERAGQRERENKALPLEQG